MMDKEYYNGFLLLEKYGFSYEEVVKIMDDCSFEKIEDNSLGIILDNSCKYLLDRGYSFNELREMVLLSPRCLIASDSKRQIVEDTFLQLGMTMREFRTISIKCTNIYSYSKERIDSYINFFRDLGFDNKEIIKVFKYVIFIFRSSISKLKKLCEDMKNIGFTDEDIYVIAKGNPTFWTHNINKIEDIINTFSFLGFSFEQIIIILRRSPSLFGYSRDTIVYKFNELINLGLSKEELRYIVCIYPTIINASIDRTKEIIEFFKGLGLYECLLEDPRNFFMQGLETSYARYCFYIDKNKVVDKESYIKLFLGWKKFEKLYGIGKDELLERYPYNKYCISKYKKK